ncbi:Disease resistance protein TAO1 [Cardamine amara subsp. amara]|uniref:ADP-ribosyl cyclase/cyclic ADP-ribose hydrolase n=1 Tax=Cardamine amara subsp. amara TaxID=228776 RepID=A0ABD1AR91_CARAN
MASSSSLLALSFPSSSSSRNWEHDVFPSFHGPDVRKTFLSHVLREFRRKGIHRFIDNEIKRGEFIGPELIRAIRGSKILIVLLSKNYASSSWCLDELVEIMKKELDQKVVTIFYEVDPTDVKKHTGYFGKVFKKTCKGKTKEKIETWRKALERVSTIAGYHSSKWDDESAMIEKIASDIWEMLNHLTISHDFDHLIGMEAHMERMIPLLRFDLDEVRMIGILGPPGIGKTTIAKFLFNLVSNSFHNSAIMVNIRGSYPRLCLDEDTTLLQLQSRILSLLTNQKDIVIHHLGVAQDRLRENKVFLVLDDVDRSAQLDALAKDVKWFGPGSRIIITTENLRLLKAHDGVNHIYKVDFPSDDEALQMFCMYAFDQKTPKDGFAELAYEVTHLVGQLPLGLKVMGSHFRGFPKEEWSMEVENLRANLDGNIESILKFSYDALCDEDKYLFLHIACFFNYDRMERVEAYLAKSFKNVRQKLHVLADKSLLTIHYVIHMHDLLVQLGKEIVRKQSVHEPGKRQFLVDDKDTCEVLTDCTAIAKSVIGIDINELDITGKAFERMTNLQFLRVGYQSPREDMISSTGPLHISPKIRLLYWSVAPITSLPLTDNLEFLVELRMVDSELEKMWDGIKLLQNLKWMNLKNSTNLKELPNLSTATSLEKLNLSGCSSLVELPSSIGNATNLKTLYLSECSSLVEIPSSIGNATNLQELDLSECTSLVELPFSIGNATNLKTLNLNGCSSLVELPFSIGNLHKLENLYLQWCLELKTLPININMESLDYLDLCGCSSLVELPSSIGNATNLKTLNLRGCSSLVELPSSIGNATNLKTILYLSKCSSLVKLPFSIGNATNLKILNLSGCSSLVEIPSSIGNATNLQELYLSGCTSLVKLPFSIGNATNLERLYLSECSSLGEIPSSIGNATNLQELYLSECTSLVELPFSIGNATNLETLNLNGCSSLVELPFSIGNATNLKTLYLNGCSSLVELPFSIGNLHKLENLYLQWCLELKTLPININMESLDYLDLSDCWSLKSFPEISKNIRFLNLIRTSIKEVPLSIRSWSRLTDLHMSYTENLKEFPYIHNIITKLHLRNTDFQELGSWVRGFSSLHELVLKGMKNLVSLPQLPDSISVLDAQDCESLEKLDCSFCHPDIRLNFGNCFKLNKEARDLIIQKSNFRGFAVLPGGEVPECFTYKASGSSVTVKLNQKPLRTLTMFKACILLVNKGENEDHGWLFSDQRMDVFCNITSRQNALIACTHEHHIEPVLKEHLYIFDIKAEEVTSTELVFEFKHIYLGKTWEIKECGIIHLLEHHVDENFSGLDEEICQMSSSALASRSFKRRRI